LTATLDTTLKVPAAFKLAPSVPPLLVVLWVTFLWLIVIVLLEAVVEIAVPPVTLILVLEPLPGLNTKPAVVVFTLKEAAFGNVNVLLEIAVTWP